MKVDRKTFLFFLAGRIMTRDKDGNVVIIDNLKIQAEMESALADLEKTERIYLTESGQIVSVLENDGEEYVEREYTGGE